MSFDNEIRRDHQQAIRRSGDLIAKPENLLIF
jgi:hypothetical protein